MPKKTLAITLLLLAAAPARAEDDSLTSGQIQNYVGYGAIAAALVLFIIAFLVILRAFKVLSKIILHVQETTAEQFAAEIEAAFPPEKEKKSKNEVFLKLMSLKPLSEEKSLLIDHEYDGIQELNNPTPAWFMWLFYGTIAFGICYVLIYHVFSFGQLQDEEYRTEVAQADSAKKVWLSKTANRVDENTVTLIKDPAVIASGEAIFKTTCAACHGEHAQGSVGPNLTDDYWLHGGKINQIFKTIKYGVAAKGMPTWEKQLSPKQMSDVANFIKSIHGTKPAGAKEPQGEKETDDDQKLAANK